LTFKLTPDIEDFIQGPLNQRIGTSWDPAIRFANAKQESLWRSNVERLLSQGVTVKLFISVTQDTIDIEPIELLRWVRDLGVQELDLERLTNNGNARQHPDIFPNNREQDQWFLKMHRQIQQHDARSWFANEFMENIYDKFERNLTGGGTFCRDCEQKLFTINADGTVGGCPNAAPEENFGHISMGIEEIMTHPQRIHNIACESHRNPLCYDCDVFDKCGSDCHQLSWQDDVCGAPKSLMRELKYGINQDMHKITPKVFKIVPV
jgi:radical SAM protein with 4Fe4S-binding SPASM domain